MMSKKEKKILGKGLSAILGNNLKQENKLKEYGVGAQILIDLGVKKMNLISDTNATPINLEGYDLEISNRQPLEDKN